MLLININLALISWKLSLHCVGAADENHLILAIPIATAQPPSSSSLSLPSSSSSSSGKEDHLLMGGLGLVQPAGDVSHMVWTTVCYISLLSLCVTICFKMLQYVWYNMLHQHMVWTTICYICSSRQDFHFSSFLIVVHNATEPVPHSNSFLIILGSMRAAAHQVSTHLFEKKLLWLHSDSEYSQWMSSSIITIIIKMVKRIPGREPLTKWEGVVLTNSASQWHLHHNRSHHHCPFYLYLYSYL